MSEGDNLWIFGYGSLMWKANFSFIRKEVGYIDGYERRFYQGSTDHRGIPGKPGRVVTLLEKSGEKVWGVAYEVAAKDVASVLAYLDYREKDGYKSMWVTFYPRDITSYPSSFQAKLYIATPQNKSYLGPAPLPEMAEQILNCKGISGTNYAYLINLAQAVREISPQIMEDELFKLEALVKAGLLHV